LKRKQSRGISKARASSVDGSGARSDADLVKLWLARRPKTTRKAYQQDLAWWTARGLFASGLAGLRLLHVDQALEGVELGGSTLVRRVSSLRSLLSFAHKVGYLAINIGAVIQTRPPPNKLAERILDPDEVLRLLVAALQSPRQGARDHLFVRMAYVSGARVSELVGLDWEHVHPDAKGGATLTLLVKGGRTRHVWITEGTAAELVVFQGPIPRKGPIFRSRFGGRLSARDAERLVEAAAKRAKLRKVSPHWLRHGHATHALERGATILEVSSDMGHASVATTSRYLHAKPGPGSARFLGL
jgi:integrase/recombinase XerD